MRNNDEDAHLKAEQVDGQKQEDGLHGLSGNADEGSDENDMEIEMQKEASEEKKESLRKEKLHDDEDNVSEKSDSLSHSS